MAVISETIVKPPHQYTREMPNIFGFSGPAGLKNWTLSNIAQGTVDCPSEYYSVIADCYVFNAAFVLHREPFEWVEDTVRGWKFKDDVHATQKWRISKGEFATELATCVGRRNVVIACLGYANYGHILVEMAPKLIHVAKANLGPVNVLVPAEMTPMLPVLKALAGALEIDAEFPIVEDKQLSLYSEIVYFGPISQHNIRKSATLVEARTALVRSCAEDGAVTGRSLFVRRGDGNARRTNPDLDMFFEAAGFEIVDPGQMTFEDQVRTFRAAKRIAGPLGAGMTNIMFTEPGCEVFMLDPGLHDFFFWDLCGLVSGKFNWFFTGDLQHFSTELARAPIVASIPDVKSAFQRIGWL